jgi:hypothetical protein
MFAVQHTHGGRVGAGAWSAPGGTVDREELSDGFLQGYRVPQEPPNGDLPKCSPSTVFLNLCSESGGGIPVVRGEVATGMRRKKKSGEWCIVGGRWAEKRVAFGRRGC